MPELRRDPVVGYWTIISTERARRPMEFVSRDIAETRECPFCEGREHETTDEIYAVRKEGSKENSPGWQARAFLSKVPMLSPSKKSERTLLGIYDSVEAAGTHEIIVESPKHLSSMDELEASEIAKVVEVYVERFKDLEKDKRFKYGLLFKNHGLISGQARDVIRHTRSQLIATPVTPKRVKEELVAAKRYFEKNERCVFCDVLRQEMKDSLRIVLDSENFIAFCPYASRQPFEVWIFPKKHAADFGKLDPSLFLEFGKALKQILFRMKSLLNDPPYNCILHTAPFRHEKSEGRWATIERDYHWYYQISPRLTHDAGFEWGTGVHINPTPPEDAAYLLREVKEI